MVDLKIKLPEHFLDEEVRCGYTVTHEMKKIWAVELDLVNELVRVCKKYDIAFATTGGTTLGAVRHDGFIPWDDDIDFQMTRKNYDRLCEVASKEFKHPYFFQTQYTDPGSLRGHAQLRNSMTTAILKAEQSENLSFNQGIFIDIFPYDAIIEDEKKLEEQRKYVEKNRKIFENLSVITCRYSKTRETSKWKAITKACLHPVMNGLDSKFNLVNHYYKKFEEGCAMYNDEKCEYYSALSFDFRKKWYRTAASFENLIWHKFEFIELPIPSDYDNQLRTTYGDYMTFQIGTSVHGGMIIDTDKPYTDYIQK